MIVLGDVHRRWEEAAATIIRAGLRGRTIMQVGDFGLGFGDPGRERLQLAALGEALARSRNRLLIVRGNHDNPALFRAHATFAAGAIQVVPDYSLVMVEGHKVLVVGGAISVDRKLRRAGRSYWPDEACMLDLDRLAALDLDGLAGVVTHAAPGIAPPILRDRFVAGPPPGPPPGIRPALRRLYARDATLAADVLAERRMLDALYGAIRLRTAIPHWIYGHYHHHDTSLHDGTRFTMLGAMQLLEIALDPLPML